MDYYDFFSTIEYANAFYVRKIVTSQLLVIVESYKFGVKVYLLIQARVINVQMIKSLETEEIIKYAKTKFELHIYLLKYRTLRLLSRL